LGDITLAPQPSLAERLKAGLLSSGLHLQRACRYWKRLYHSQEEIPGHQVLSYALQPLREQIQEHTSNVGQVRVEGTIHFNPHAEYAFFASNMHAQWSFEDFARHTLFHELYHVAQRAATGRTVEHLEFAAQENAIPIEGYAEYMTAQMMGVGRGCANFYAPEHAAFTALVELNRLQDPKEILWFSIMCFDLNAVWKKQPELYERFKELEIIRKVP